MNDFVITIDGEKIMVDLLGSDLVKIKGEERKVEISKLSDYTYHVQLDNKVFHITVNNLVNSSYNFLIDGHYFDSLVRTKLEERASEILELAGGDKGEEIVYSPMPGLILRLDKNIGDSIRKGDSIILLEAMKMENELRAPKDGIISDIYVEEGNSVEKNQKLLLIK